MMVGLLILSYQLNNKIIAPCFSSMNMSLTFITAVAVPVTTTRSPLTKTPHKMTMTVTMNMLTSS